MGDLNLVNSNGDDHLIYGVQYGYAMKNLVTNQETPISVYPLNITPISAKIKTMFVDKNLPGRVYTFASGNRGNKINMSDDYGVTESPLYTANANLFLAAETDPNNPNIAWLATRAARAVLTKSNFTDRSNPVNEVITLPYNQDFLRGIKFVQNRSNEILITVGNQVFKTYDGGLTWTRITAGLEELTLPSIAISLTQNPLNANQFTIAASNGIYTSLDAGNTWTKIYSGMITSVEHSTKKNGQIVGIGASSGTTLPKVVFSNNGGSTWEERTSSNYYNTLVISGTARFINDTTAEVYLATNSLGILKDIITFTTLAASNENTVADYISIYPNPVVDIVNVKSASNGSKFKITIYSVTGQQVMSAENKTSMNISKLPKGVYLLKLDRDNVKTVVKKIIKK